MYSETLEKMNKYGMAKVNLLKESKLKYFVASMLAGLYVGLGIILIMTIGGYTKHGGMQYKVFMGLAFGMVNCNKYLPFFSKKSACLLKIDLLTSNQLFSYDNCLSNPLTL